MCPDALHTWQKLPCEETTAGITTAHRKNLLTTAHPATSETFETSVKFMIGWGLLDLQDEGRALILCSLLECLLCMSYLALAKFAGHSHPVFYFTNRRTLGSGNIGFDALLARRSDGLLKLRQAQRKWRHCVGEAVGVAAPRRVCCRGISARYSRA